MRHSLHSQNGSLPVGTNDTYVRAMLNVLSEWAEDYFDSYYGAPALVESAHIILAVCKELGLKAEAIEVAVLWANAAKFRDAWPAPVRGPAGQSPHMTAFGFTRSRSVGPNREYGGYLVVMVENRYIIDIMAQWWQDPERGIITPSSLVATARHLAGAVGNTVGSLLHDDDETVTATVYTRRTMCPSVLRHPSWSMDIVGLARDVAHDVQDIAAERLATGGDDVMSIDADGDDPRAAAEAAVFASLVAEAWRCASALDDGP